MPVTKMRAQFQPRAGFTMIEIMIVVIIIGVLAAVGIPSMLQSREKAQHDTCLNNLRQIDGAKQQWAFENKKVKNTPVTAADINSYIRSGMPLCPASGTYTIGPVGTKPTCSVAGHVMD